MKFLKKVFAGFLVFILLGTCVFNVRLYYAPEYAENTHAIINTDLKNQLVHLQGEMHGGAADEMQKLYPEGFVFLNALYGLSWIELAEYLPLSDPLHEEALEEINWVLEELTSDKAKAPFRGKLPLKYGAFYRGWSNYVQGRKLALLQEQDRDSTELLRFGQTCREIVHALKQQQSPFLESYSQACWPADMTVAMASVAIHEQLFPGTYQQDIKNWLEKVEAHADAEGFIPHKSHWKSAKVLQAARGSSQSLILNFLIEIDSTYAKEKFQLYKHSFLDFRLGLPGIREYPKGSYGRGDIDSGPVIWEIGGAASIVGQRVMALYREDDTAIGLRNSIETFGLGKSTGGKKNYLFGALPMADAFIAWSNSTEAHHSERLIGQSAWRSQIQWMSGSLILILGLMIYFLLKKNRYE